MASIYRKAEIPEHLQRYFRPAEIGLEESPEAFVAQLVDVFREVRRVLRPDGVLWLNLGDSYASGGRTWRAPNNNGMRSGAQRERMDFRPADPEGIKPKDLLGIPWRVAFALQQPYYSGRIHREADRIWLAAMIDAEGCMYIHKRREGQNNGQGYCRKSDSYGAGLEIANTSEAIVQRCLEITGKGSIFRHEKDRRQPLFRWTLRSNECREIIREVYPYLVGKQHQARLVLGCPSSGERAEAAHQALIHLHNGRLTDVDFPTPAPMFEPGYYLRSDVIWSKANPMPESVTDRPTKAHEYVFLLSKSASYFYDADAIKEKAAQPVGTPTLTGTQTKADAGGFTTNGHGASTLGTNQGAPYRNKRTVWEIATQPFPEAHFATYPEELARLCILAGSREGDLVLDPFGGSGTTAAVAVRHGRRAVICELNPEYVQIARRRIGRESSLFTGALFA